MSFDSNENGIVQHVICTNPVPSRYLTSIQGSLKSVIFLYCIVYLTKSFVFANLEKFLSERYENKTLLVQD